MRSTYLRSGSPDNRGGSRGGVGSGNHDDYDLEIGNNQNADPEMLALCAMVDEMREYLNLVQSPIAKVLLHQWKQLTAELETQRAKSAS